MSTLVPQPSNRKKQAYIVVPDEHAQPERNGNVLDARQTRREAPRRPERDHRASKRPAPRAERPRAFWSHDDMIAAMKGGRVRITSLDGKVMTGILVEADKYALVIGHARSGLPDLFTEIVFKHAMLSIIALGDCHLEPGAATE